MNNVVVGLDLHLKKTQGTIMAMDGTIVKQDRFNTNKEEFSSFLEDVPEGTPVALESLGFYWPWIDLIEELGYQPLLANPAKVKFRAEDVKTDKVDSELLAHLTRMNWLPTSYVPDKELRNLRSLLRHRSFRRRITTSLKNRTWSEYRKRDLKREGGLWSQKGRDLARATGIYEIEQNMDLLDGIEIQIKEIEKKLKKQYSHLKPIQLLETIPGIGFISAITIYAEICSIERFRTPEKLAHYAGLVPKVRQSAEHTSMGRMAKGNKWILIEASWSHIQNCPHGRLAKVYKEAKNRKKRATMAIKIVARKLLNVIWAVWTHQTAFRMESDSE